MNSKKEAISEQYKNKLVIEKIAEYLSYRFWETEPNIREVWLLDFQTRIWLKIKYDPNTNEEYETKRSRKKSILKKYLPLK